MQSGAIDTFPFFPCHRKRRKTEERQDAKWVSGVVKPSTGWGGGGGRPSELKDVINHEHIRPRGWDK